MRVLGIDPGASGGVALVQDSVLIWAKPTPILRLIRGKTVKAEVDGYAFAEMLDGLLIDCAVMEIVGGMTGQSAPAAFNFGRATGVVEGVIRGKRYPLEFISSGRWRQAAGLKPSSDRKQRKDESRALAMRRWPKFVPLFQYAKNEGLAEAALIASGWVRYQQRMGSMTDVWA